MVSRPEEYRWSSYGINAWGDDGWLVPHAEYLQLGSRADERLHTYRELFRNQISEQELHLIRKAAHYCQPVADDRFKLQIESKYHISLGVMKRRRPKKRDDG